MYTVVGYDKDNDAYIVYAEYSVEWLATMKANELVDKIKRGELRREDNDEPIDWIEVYEDYNKPNEKRLHVFSPNDN